MTTLDSTESSYVPVRSDAPGKAGDVGRVPPHSIGAEACVLGSMILDAAAVDIVVQITRGEHFYRPAHQIIFEAIIDLRQAIKPIDLVTLREELDRRKLLSQVGNVEYLAALVEGDGGYKAAGQMLASGRKYTAILCGNDYVAVGAAACIKHHGFQVPGDFALIGFSGDELGEYSTPPLTTMYQPAEEIGRTAVDCMMKILEGSPVDERTLFTASLLVREST
jgi:hypothetical protein